MAEPVLAALLLGKAAQANERGMELVLTENSRIDDGVLPASLPARDLVTILGNLIDNAMDAVRAGDGARVTVTALVDEDRLVLAVRDTGAGVDPADVESMFRRGWSTRGPGRGLGLALVRQAVHRHTGRWSWSKGRGAGLSSPYGCLSPVPPEGVADQPAGRLSGGRGERSL